MQAGAAFQLSLRVENRTHHLQELALRLGDTSGFVLAGGTPALAGLYRMSAADLCRGGLPHKKPLCRQPFACKPITTGLDGNAVFTECAGMRVGSVAVLPYQEATVRFQLVPVAAGSLPLPEITLWAARYGAELHPLAGHRVFAAPAAVSAAPPLPDAGALVAGFAQLST